MVAYGAYGAGWKFLVGEYGPHGLVVFLPQILEKGQDQSWIKLGDTSGVGIRGEGR
jgi:hypothetical protein